MKTYQTNPKHSSATAWMRRACSALATLLLLLLGLNAYGQAGPNWTGLAGDYLWSNTNNWASDSTGNPPNLVPTDGATVYILGNPTAPLNYDITTNVILRGIYFKADQYLAYGPWTVNGNPMIITSEESLRQAINSLAAGGTTIRTDCGRMICRIACHLVIPSDIAASC